MRVKIIPWKIGIAAGSMLTVVSFICMLFFVITPETTLNLANNVFHGIDLNQIAKSSLSLEGVVTGLLVVFILGFVSGLIFGGIYNKII